VVISGHTHQAYICQLPNAVGRAIPVTSANAFGRLVTDIDMQLDPHSGQVLDVTAHNIVVDRSNTALTPSATIASIVAGYDRLVAPVAHQVIGSITADIPNRKTAACDVPAGHLIADAQLAATRSANFGAAQIALMNPGGVRASGFVYTPARGSEPAGDITYAEAFTAQPFGNSLVTMTLTAQQVKDVLEQQFAGCQIPGQPARTVTRVLLPSRGFQFTWDATRPACEKIVTVALMADGVLDTLVDQGVVRQPTRPYRVTVNSYLAAGGDGFSLFKAGTERLGGAQDIDALVAYFAAFKRPHPAYDPQAPDLAQPRISRADSGTTCP
jgi:5'-nucleotidase